MAEYDYKRFDQLIETIIRDYCEVDDDPDYLEVGENISGIAAVKVIFDGFGLAEEYYYNSRTFQLQDDVVMVQNDDWEYDELSEDDEDYEHVKEKLELFEQYRNSDGPCNPQSQSFAVFIHRGAIDPEFEFPEHDFTPWGLIHRTKEEVCVYAWWDRDTDAFDILPLEDRTSDTEMNEEDVMKVLESVADTYGLDTVDEEETDVEYTPSSLWPFPTSTKPAESSWPFPSGKEAVAKTTEEPTAEEEEEEEVEEEEEETNDQDYRGILERVVEKRGLPKEVGVRGWITYQCGYMYNDKRIGETEEGNKGWICVQRDVNEYYSEEPGYTNVNELLYVIEAMIDDRCDETSLDVDTEDGEGRSVQLINEESDGKSWDFQPSDEFTMDEIYALIRAAKIEDGEDEDEINSMDDDDLDINEFLWDKCMDVGGESYYSTPYGVAFLEFDDGFRMGFTKKANKLYVNTYNGEDVNSKTVFE